MNPTRGLTRTLRIAEWALAVAGVIALTIAGTTSLRRGAILVVYLTTLAALPLYWRQTGRQLIRLWPVLLVVALALISALWSASPMVTLTRGMGLIGTTLFGMFLMARFRLDDQIKALALALGIAGIVSTVVVLLAPMHGVMGEKHPGAWMGFYEHKNLFGRTVAFAAVVYLLLALSSHKLRPLASVGLVFTLGLTFASRSRTAIAVAFACIALIVVLSVVQHLPKDRRGRVLIVMGVIAVLSALSTALFADVVFGLVGRDVSFTGRTRLWGMIVDQIRLRPWFGYGFRAFWHSDADAPITAIRGEEVPHAHNGFIELVVELGIVGLAVFLVPFLYYLGLSAVWAVSKRSPLRLWPVTYLVFFVLSNLTESTLVRDSKIYWVLYVAAVLALYQSDAPASDEAHRDERMPTSP